jgi:TetR/AcrR family transcriptional regulator
MALRPTVRRRSPAAKRTPGRPAAGIDLRGKLLDAAIARFSELGIAATTLRAIAQAAHVTPALLHYYFGNKDAVAAAVLEERIAPLFTALSEQIERPAASPGTAVLDYLKAHLGMIAEHPWLPPLMMREVYSEGGSLRELLLKRGPMAIGARLPKLIAQAQVAGELRADMDPRLVALSLISLVVFPFATAPIWRRSLKGGGADIGTQTLIEHTLALATRGMEIKHARRR